MLIPYIKFHEVLDGVTPIRRNITNRIGMVGITSRGPTDFQFIGGYNHFAREYGIDNKIGSLGFQAAYDQGAREFGFTRVLGAERIASGELRFSGISNKHNRLILKLIYTGEMVNRTDRDINTPIFVSGVPLTEVNGRLWFRVQEIDEEGFARIAIHFLPDGTNSTIDWSETTESLPEGWVYSPDRSRLVPDPSNPPTVRHEGEDILLDRNFPWDDILDEWVPPLITTTTVVEPEVIYPAGREDVLGNSYNAGEYNYYESANPLNFEVNSVRPTERLILNVREDAGRPFSAPFGTFISFGATEQIEDIDLEVGDTWSVKLISSRHEVDIFDGYAPNQIATALIESLAGVDPIGEIERNASDDGVIFHLMEELGGAAGNRFAYYLDIVEPDGQVICDTTYYGGERYAHVPIQFAHHIKDGALVEMVNTEGRYGIYNFSDPETGPSSTPNTLASIVPALTRVVKVELPLTGDLALVWFDKPLNAPFNSIAPFRYINDEGLSFNHHTFYNHDFMSGGLDGPRRAFRDFFDYRGVPILRLISSSEGAWANSVRVDIYPLDSRYFRLTVTDLNKDNYQPPLPDESYTLSFTGEAVDSNGVINALNGSAYIRGLFLPKFFNNLEYNKDLETRMPMRTAPPDYRKVNQDDPANPAYFGPKFLKGISLEGGYDGPPPNETDYIKAINKMKTKAVHILVAPGIYRSRAVQQTMISQAENAEELEGLRIAVINGPPGLRPSSASRVLQGITSPRAVAVLGWATYGGQVNAPRYGLSPDAIYAGKLGAIPFYVNPAARTSSGPVNGIVETDMDVYSSNGQLQQLSDGRFEVLYQDPNLFGFYFLTGRTTSNTERWYAITKRRAYDVVRAGLYMGLQEYKSEPLTERLLSRIASSVDGYFNLLMNRGEIASFTASTVTTPGLASRQVDVRVSFQELNSADYIDIYLVDNWNSQT